MYFVTKVKENTMVKKNLWLGIMVMVPVFGMTVVGCDDDSTQNNPFDGTSWYLDDDSVLDFYGSTWTWYEHRMYNTNDVLTDYDFKGTYTYKGNTATMISTHYRIPQGYWISLSEEWTATITENGNGISVVYDGGIRSRMLLKEQNSEFNGHRKMK
jgi:hypothetical protein